MQEIGAFEAKNTLSALPDRVEQGEEVVITRRGRPVAKLVRADALFDRIAERGAYVPSIWRPEVANGLQAAVRRRRIDGAYRDLALSRLMAQRITVDDETDRHAWSAIVRLAELHALSIYDASYLELALRLTAPLATVDKALAAAAQRVGLSSPVLQASPR